MTLMYTNLSRIAFYIVFASLIIAVKAFSSAVDADRQSITLAIMDEPPKMNSLISSDGYSAMVLDHITEGLLTYDEHGQLAPGVAKKWQLTERGATFWLREDAKWNDGRPVTAHDFVFAWRQVLNPGTASPYAFILFPLKNAEAINQGKLPLEKLGVHAIGDYKLVVELAQPTTYFLELVAYKTYRPIREDALKKWGRAYAADADKMLFNGPFILREWVHGASLKMVKNPNYWQTKKVSIQEINIAYVTKDESTLFNLFRQDKIATWIRPSLNESGIKKALKAHLPMKKFNLGALAYLEFNHRSGRPTANVNLRKAIQQVFDTVTYVNKVEADPGPTPAYSLFPDWVEGSTGPLKEQYPPERINNDLKQARAYMQQAKQDLGVDRIPPLVLLCDDTESASKGAEYLQNLLATTLGLEIKIDKQIFKLRIEKSLAGNFDMLRTLWGPDYNDGMTFADLLASWNLNNRGHYNNADYDNLVRLAQSTLDQEKRARAFADIQQHILDNAVIIPQFQVGNLYLQHPRLTGVRRQIFGGDPIFTYARILPEQNKE